MAMARWSPIASRGDPRLHRSGAAALVDVDERRREGAAAAEEAAIAGRGARAWLEDGEGVVAERYNEADH